MLSVTMQKAENVKTDFAFANQPVSNFNETFKDVLNAKVTAPRKNSNSTKTDKSQEAQRPEQQEDNNTINQDPSNLALLKQQTQDDDNQDQILEMEDLPVAITPKPADEAGYMLMAAPVTAQNPDVVLQYADQGKTLDGTLMSDTMTSDAINGQAGNPLLAQEVQQILTQQSPDLAQQAILLTTVSENKQENLSQNGEIHNQGTNQIQHRAEPAPVQGADHQPVGEVFQTDNHTARTVEEKMAEQEFRLIHTTESETPHDKKITVRYESPEEYHPQEKAGDLVQKPLTEALASARVYSGKENTITAALGQDNIIHQVTNNIAAMVKQSTPKFTMELTPETLGKITVEMQYKEGGLELKISTESAVTTKILTEQISQLKNALSANQVEVQTIDVNTSPGFDFSFSNLSKGYQQTGNEQGASNRQRYRDADYLNQDLGVQASEYENITAHYSRNQLLNYLV